MITSKNEPQSVGGGFLSPDVFFGLSTDDKPTTKVANGSTFKEIDTGKEYLFDYSGGEWHEAPSSGGGGGGGGGGGSDELFIGTVTVSGSTLSTLTCTADKTLAETLEASATKRILIRVIDGDDTQDVLPVFSTADEYLAWNVFSASPDGEGGGTMSVYAYDWEYGDDDSEVITIDHMSFSATPVT